MARADLAILEEVFGINAIRAALFSDFPRIVLIDPSDDLRESDWHVSLNEFQLRYLDGALFFLHDRPLIDFSRDAIPSPLSPEMFLDPRSLPELQRLLERHRRSVLIFARDEDGRRQLPAN